MDEAKITDFDNGLRILGRMIARAYLKDFRQKASQQTSIVEQKNANQGSANGTVAVNRAALTDDAIDLMRFPGYRKGQIQYIEQAQLPISD